MECGHKCMKRPNHGEAACAARWMLTPFPLCSLQCAAPTALSRWGVLRCMCFNHDRKKNSTRDVLNSKYFPVQFRVGLRKYCFVLPGVLFFSIQICLMMQSLFTETESAYLNRPLDFYSHSSAQRKLNKFVRPYWSTAPNRLWSMDGWSHE